MEGPAGGRQRAAIDKAIAAALSGTELPGSEFIGALTQDAVRYLADLADQHGHGGEKVKTCAAPP